MPPEEVLSAAMALPSTQAPHLGSQAAPGLADCVLESTAPAEEYGLFPKNKAQRPHLISR